MSAPVSLIRSRLPPTFFFFFFNDTATTEIYTLSLHDALPISLPFVGSWPCRIRGRMVAPDAKAFTGTDGRSEEHTSELQSHSDLVCRLLLEKKKKQQPHSQIPSFERADISTSIC